MIDDDVPSPCICVCKMDPALGSPQDRAAGGLCVGCRRTLDEIIEWGTATDTRKRAILDVLRTRGPAA